MTRVLFHPEAQAELLAAARFYEDQAQNLGFDFLNAIESTCRRVVDFPEIGQTFGSSLRRVLVPRFPYGLIYRSESDRLWIVAVANLYKRPGYWRQRE